MERKSPLVYIIISIYNGEAYFLEQLISIYYQNYNNWYLIIVDDGSTDSSYQIAEDFIKNYKLDNKVKIIKQKNQGTCKAVENGLKEVQKIAELSDLVSLCDADDVWCRNKLEIQVEYMNEHKECDLCFHDLSLIDENNELKASSFLKSKFKISNPNNNSLTELLTWNHITTTEILFRAKYIGEVIPIENQGAKDYRIVLIFALNKKNIHFIDKVLGYYRSGHNSIQSELRHLGEVSGYQRDLNMLNLLKIRFPQSYEICYFSGYLNSKINRYRNGYGLRHRRILFMINYPKIFFLIIKNKISNYIKK